jgi:hypothetical protein
MERKINNGWRVDMYNMLIYQNGSFKVKTASSDVPQAVVNEEEVIHLDTLTVGQMMSKQHHIKRTFKYKGEAGRFYIYEEME